MKTILEIITEWKGEAGLPAWKETIAIHRCGHTLYIVTQRPGIFIGRAGCLVDKYTEMLKKNGHNLTVQFVDTFCGDIKVF